MREMVPSEQFMFGRVPHKYISSMGFKSGEGGNIAKQNKLYATATEYWGDSNAINSFCSDLGFYQDNTAEGECLLSKHQGEQRVQSFSNIEIFDDLYFDIVSPQFQPCQEDITKLASIQSEISALIEPQIDKPRVFPLASLEVLNNYGSKFREPNYGTACTKVRGQKLSTVAIIRLSGEKFIQSFSQRVDDLSVLSHPFATSFFGVSDEETRDVELVQCLLASAEKVGQQQFDRASKLLNQCDLFSSKEGNTVQRLVYYFSEALREKIGRETGRITTPYCLVPLDEEIMSPSPSVIAFHQDIPFFQVSQFTGIQALVENVADAKKVHLIDLEIRTGTQSTVLMQALAARREFPIEHLKITAIGMISKPNIEIGKRLMDFAHSLNLSFSFNVVMVADMLELNESLFELDPEEAVVIDSQYILCNMIAQPDRLECLMKVIRNINPRVMVVSEIEANLCSPVFVSRFIEALFFYGAYFECMEESMDHDRLNRLIMESVFFGQAIRNVVAVEGEERTIRHVNINVWRAFFARFGMVEIELSMSSLYQASLVSKSFTCGTSCSLDMDGKSLLIGWKGTPAISLSAWKFQ